MNILRTENITKIYPGTKALDNISTSFEGGKVHAICGKNGSGKSTMVKIFSGAVKPTEGRVYLNDEALNFESPQDAINKKISTVYQELSLFPGLTVTENILLGRMPMKGKFIDWKKANQLAEKYLKDLGVKLETTKLVVSLSMWQRQMLEIVKAMSSDPKVLMLDEPTSSLSKDETKLLFDMVKRLKEKGVIIIYISHRLQELWEIADTCTVIRDGNFIGRTEMKETTHRELIKMMFGDVEIKTRPADLKVGEKTVLEVKSLNKKGTFKDISFKLKESEILGIAGMLGSGRSEILRSIFGADKFDSGEVIFFDKKIEDANPKIMKNLGLAMTPEDRKHEGLIQMLSVHTNLCVAAREHMSKGPFIKVKDEQPYVDKQIESLQIKVPNTQLPMNSLSGGNQQKVVVGNWLNINPRVIFFDEPSRGIDINAKQQIFEIIWEQSRKGISSIIVSSELEELLEVCNRILILKDGEIINEVNADDCNIEELYELCLGGN
ncbi:MAG: sugar ABC transporter ATP-binding protein [Proteocatella sp.]